MGQRKDPKDIQDFQQLQGQPPKAQDQRLMTSKERLYVTLLDTAESLLEDMEFLVEFMEESRQAFTLEQLAPLGMEPLPRWAQRRRHRRHGELRVPGHPIRRGLHLRGQSRR